MTYYKDDDIEALASSTLATTPGPKPKGKWSPDLNPTQQKIFDTPSRFVLGYGEKGSGKTIAFGHKVIRHAYENDNALVLIVAPSIRTGSEGIWHDLDTLIIPAWQEGIGLETTVAKLDPNTKDRHRWIKNRFGGWSKLLLVSIPYAAAVESRVKGPAPSMVYVDEITNCDGRQYMTYPAAQLGRRRGIAGPQQFCASCNPEGPSHWVYKVFFEECFDEETGERDKDMEVFHVPVTENLDRLPDGYVENLHRILRSDPVEKRRLIDGEWVDRPTGEALFKDYFQPSTHIKGDAMRGDGLVPVRGYPIIIGYDLGQVFSSVTFLQLVPTKNKLVWLVIDEADHLGERILYKRLVQEILQKMAKWSRRLDYEFKYQHISDSSSINTWHPGGEGSYDSWDIERFSGGKIRLQGCPKGSGSVEARVRILQSKLFQDEFYVSAVCQNTIDTLNNLEGDDKTGIKPKRSKYIHKFDSISYPLLKLELTGGRNYLPQENVRPHLIHCGVN